MDKWQSLIEEHIKKAEREGEFENLKGKGKPQDLSTNPFEDSENKMTYKILKNAGILPPEVEAKKRLGELVEKLKSEELSPEERKSLEKKKRDLELKVNLFFESMKRR